MQNERYSLFLNDLASQPPFHYRILTRNTFFITLHTHSIGNGAECFSFTHHIRSQISLCCLFSSLRRISFLPLMRSFFCSKSCLCQRFRFVCVCVCVSVPSNIPTWWTREGAPSRRASCSRYLTQHSDQGSARSRTPPCMHEVCVCGGVFLIQVKKSRTTQFICNRGGIGGEVGSFKSIFCRVSYFSDVKVCNTVLKITDRN